MISLFLSYMLQSKAFRIFKTKLILFSSTLNLLYNCGFCKDWSMALIQRLGHSLVWHVIVKVNLRITNSKFSTAGSMIYDGPYSRNHYIWSSLLIGRKIVNDKCHDYSFKILLSFWLAQIRWLIFWLDLLKHGYRNFSQTSPEYFFTEYLLKTLY